MNRIAADNPQRESRLRGCPVVLFPMFAGKMHSSLRTSCIRRMLPLGVLFRGTAKITATHLGGSPFGDRPVSP